MTENKKTFFETQLDKFRDKTPEFWQRKKLYAGLALTTIYYVDIAFISLVSKLTDMGKLENFKQDYIQNLSYTVPIAVVSAIALSAYFYAKRKNVVSKETVQITNEISFWRHNQDKFECAISMCAILAICAANAKLDKLTNAKEACLILVGINFLRIGLQVYVRENEDKSPQDQAKNDTYTYNFFRCSASVIALHIILRPIADGFSIFAIIEGGLSIAALYQSLLLCLASDSHDR